METALEKESLEEAPLEYDILTKVEAILKTPDADFLKRLVDILFEQYYDPEPLSPEELAAIKESKEQLKRGEFITVEEYEKQRGL
ncbi:MAG: hypothetical protein FJ134_10125 [Deltaproteobacteria bacterium]|nr:hypothetical protein [Deltaproteobacteria bacterium]